MTKTVSFSYPSDMSSGPICGVLATAIVTGKSFTDTKDFYAKQKSSKWKGGLFSNEIVLGIRSFGMEVEEVKVSTWDNPLNLRDTVKTLNDRYPTDLFIVFIRQHVVTVFNGKIIDQQECGVADTFWCRQWKVDTYKGVYRITNATVDPSLFAPTRVLKPNLNKHRALPADSQFKNKTQGANAIFSEYVDRGMHPKVYINYILNDFCKKLNMKVATAKTYFYKIAKENGYSFSKYDDY